MHNNRQIILNCHNISVKENYLKEKKHVINNTVQLIYLDTNILFKGMF